MKLSLVFSLLLAAAQPVFAQDATEDFGKCLISTTTGADRVVLVKWIGFTIAAHPAMADSITIPKAAIEETNQAVGSLFMDLVTVRCRSQAIAAYKLNGDEAFGKAFEVLGQAAMMETMMDGAVTARMSEFTKYINEAELKQIVE